MNFDSCSGGVPEMHKFSSHGPRRTGYGPAMQTACKIAPGAEKARGIEAKRKQPATRPPAGFERKLAGEKEASSEGLSRAERKGQNGIQRGPQKAEQVARMTRGPLEQQKAEPSGSDPDDPRAPAVK